MKTFAEYLTEAKPSKGPKPPTVVEFTDEFEEWWKDLTEEEQDDVSAVVKRLIAEGVTLPFPYSSAIKNTIKYKAMRELRPQSQQVIRVFYIFDPRRIPMLLIGGLKRGFPGSMDRFYEHFVPIADSIYTEHLQEIGHA